MVSRMDPPLKSSSIKEELPGSINKAHSVLFICDNNAEKHEIRNILERDFSVKCCDIDKTNCKDFVFKSADVIVAYVAENNDRVFNTIRAICAYYIDLPRLMIIRSKEDIDIVVKSARISFFTFVEISNIRILNKRTNDIIHNSQIKVSIKKIGVERCNKNKTVNKVLTYMENNYKKIRCINEIADYFRITPNAISMYFNYEGYPKPKKILIWLKIMNALYLIKEERLLLKEVAHKSGFSKEKIMADNFKKLFNKLPTHCKEEIQGKSVQEFWEEHFNGINK